ncbi:uncharacterized protein DUF3180 [Antricoccus suffuscus]|uniref:Uncharacterized protein DUF3180 n=1 Tax=Antricoccus suffuscus TaxID=1629062 RepID=A0A2T1A4B9_9ACTN|nr:DUF3180 domain-containing protein [Antricoccus suffuscus]PRZ43168.1 uncharacterized protein DUF3180 [Antricoccus suffuscus]
MARKQLASTKASTLATIAVVAGLLSWGLVRSFYGSIPPLDWYVPLWSAILAAAEFVFGRQLKRRIDRAPGTTPPEPLVAARALAFAKASSIVGSLLVGVWAGVAIYTGGQWGYLQSAKADTVVAAFGLLCSAALVAGGIFLEYGCRTPPQKDDEDDDDPDGDWLTHR